MQPPPILKSRGNVMTIQFRTDGSFSARGFRAYIRFSYGPLQGCGGNIDLTGDSTTGEIRSLDANRDGKYEPNLNCHWVVIGRDGKNVRMSFASQFAVERAVNDTHETCWDYIEVRKATEVLKGYKNISDIFFRSAMATVPSPT